MTSPPRPRKRRVVRALLASAIGIVLAPLLAELVVRWLVFSPDPLATKLGASLREPDALSNADNDERWWYLQRRFAPPGSITALVGADPVLGWGGDVIDPATGQHADAKKLAGRRPVLLYGDSFAACVTQPAFAFQGLMEQSDLSDRYALINYGIGGYGFDQAVLMLERTLPKHLDQHPIVILSMLVESDLDRSGLAFRGWPKPKFEVVDGALRDPKPFELDPDRWFDANISIWHSYAIGVATYKQGVFSPKLQDRLYARDARIPEKRELNRLVLERAHALLEKNGVEHFVLLFHCRGTLEPKAWVTWQEPLVVETCKKLGVACLDTRPFLREAASGDWNAADAYYFLDGPGIGHLNETGNQIAFEAMREGVLGRARAPRLDRLQGLLESGVVKRVGPAMRSRVLFGREAWIRANPKGQCLRFGDDFGKLVDTHGRPTLIVRGATNEPTEFLILPDGKRHVLSGELAFAKRPGVECVPGSVRLEARNGSDVAASFDVTPEWTTKRVEIEMAPDRTFTLVATSTGDDPECAWACLVDAKID